MSLENTLTHKKTRIPPEMSSPTSSSHSDPDGIVVIEESDVVVLDDEEENSDTASFKSAADSEIVVLEEEDVLDLDDVVDDDGLNDDGLLILSVRHSSSSKEVRGNVSNSLISREVDNEVVRSIDDGTPNLEESHANNAQATDDSKNLEDLPGASVPIASSRSLQPSHSSSMTSERCYCPSKSIAR